MRQLLRCGRMNLSAVRRLRVLRCPPGLGKLILDDCAGSRILYLAQEDPAILRAGQWPACLIAVRVASCARSSRYSRPCCVISR
jgi:hypothetical protein